MRYLVFVGAYYYPDKGLGDLINMTDDLDEAIRLAEAGVRKDGPLTWGQVADLQDKKIVWQKEMNHSCELEDSHTWVESEGWSNAD